MKLLVFDVEGTLFQSKIRLPGTLYDSTIWQGIAHALGPDAEKEEVASHKTWESGGYNNYLEWMKDTILIHQRHGLTRDLFQEVISSAKYNPNVKETLSKLNRDEYEILLISGGFRELAARAQKDLGIIHAFCACEYIFGEDERLEAYNLLPCDFDGKIDFIKLMLRELKIDSNDWVFMGDGANDVSIAQKAPVSVGYRPHSKLKKVVTYAVEDFSEIIEIL